MTGDADWSDIGWAAERAGLPLDVGRDSATPRAFRPPPAQPGRIAFGVPAAARPSRSSAASSALVPLVDDAGQPRARAGRRQRAFLELSGADVGDEVAASVVRASG